MFSDSSSNDTVTAKSAEVSLDESTLLNEAAIGLVGLKNLGNTCFMNSALQILANCHPLTKLFYARVQDLSNSSHLPLSKAYLKLLFEMGHLGDGEYSSNPWSSLRHPVVSPFNVLDVIRISYPMFRGVFQHDSQEFMRAFLSDLHDEVKVKPFDESKFPCVLNSMGCTTVNSNSNVVNGGGDLCRRPTKNKRCKKKKTKVTKEDSTKEISPVLSSSVVMDVFQGGTVTCIKCLSCDKVFYRNEVFLDLSLPITSHSKPKITDPVETLPSTSTSRSLSPRVPLVNNSASTSILSGTKQLLQHSFDSSVGFFYWASFYLLLLFAWLKNIPPIPLFASYVALVTSWVKRSALNWGYTTPGVDKNLIWNPQTDLDDCLDAFFDADELSGENQYYCENCSRHTNGRMHVELTKLPEVLCLHLKRFRHEFVNTSKINSPVNFPLQRLNLKKYRHSSCKDKVSEYDLVGVVCHSGTVRFGHYYTYALNSGNGEWYEFNDSSVQHVDTNIITSLSSTAYVLFYRKRQDFIRPIRKQLTISQVSQMVYISVRWLLRFSEFADPGPITNSDFLCTHGALQPLLVPTVDKHVTMIPLDTWNYLFSHFAGGPPVFVLHPCEVCTEKLRILDLRRQLERKSFQEAPEESELMFIINRDWLKIWIDFVYGRETEPPGPIMNSVILEPLRAAPDTFRVRIGIASTRYEWISQPRWAFLLSIYGGGPEHLIRNPSYSERHSFEIGKDEIESIDAIENGQGMEQDDEDEEVQDEDSELEEINYKSSSMAFYSGDNGGPPSVRDVSPLSPSPVLDISQIGTTSSKDTSDSNSLKLHDDISSRSASTVFLRSETPSLNDDERAQSANDFFLVNDRQTKPLSSLVFSPFTDGDTVAFAVHNEDENTVCGDLMRGRKDALPNGAVNEEEREESEGEGEERGRNEVHLESSVT